MAEFASRKTEHFSSKETVLHVREVKAQADHLWDKPDSTISLSTQ